MKDQNTQMVMDVLMAVKLADMPLIVKSLTDEQIDILMKYLYKGMVFPQHFNAGVLLNWHAHVLEKGGVGSIVRVLSDRRCV